MYDDDEIYYDINDLYRYDELFDLNLNEEKLQDFAEKEKYNLCKFEDKIDNYKDDFEQITELDLGKKENAYHYMMDWFEAEIPNFKNESTREKVHQIVKEFYNDLTKLNYSIFSKDVDIWDFSSQIDPETDEYDIDINQLEKRYAQRDDSIKGAIFDGLYSTGDNLFKIYDYYKTSTFDDVCSKLESLKWEDEHFITYYGEEDKELFDGRFQIEDGDKLLTLLALIACSKFEEDLDISKAFISRYNSDGYAENENEMDFYSLLPIVKECKKISDERKKNNNTSVKQKVLINPNV
jgi:hypothetical protein